MFSWEAAAAAAAPGVKVASIQRSCAVREISGFKQSQKLLENIWSNK